MIERKRDFRCVTVTNLSLSLVRSPSDDDKTFYSGAPTKNAIGPLKLSGRTPIDEKLAYELPSHSQPTSEREREPELSAKSGSGNGNGSEARSKKESLIAFYYGQANGGRAMNANDAIGLRFITRLSV